MINKKLLSNVAIPRAINNNSARGGDESIVLSGKGAEILLDVGPESASGYTVFNVVDFTKKCKIKICYSDRLCVFDHKQGKERGDFSRGAATYLGVELPVLPANPARFELYTVCRRGKYTFPFIQGQHRYMLVTLMTEAEVEIKDVRVVSASYNTATKGEFLCDDENLNKLWLAGARTVSIATVRARQIDCVDGIIALRALTAYKRPVYVKGVSGDEWNAEVRFSVSENPFDKSAINVFLKGKEEYLLRFCDDGFVSLVKLKRGKEILVQQIKTRALIHDKIYKLNICLKDGILTCNFKNKLLQFTVIEGEYKLGFLQKENEIALLYSLAVNGKKIQNKLSNFSAFYGEWFVSDGSKRDRLPWSGDLEWAGRSAYYCFGDSNKMKNTLNMLTNKQNPEGYFFAVTYPEDRTKPQSRDWGLYQSDTFSIWIPIVCYNYALFTGDVKWLKSQFNALKKSLNYIEENIFDNGLFYQRYETSKGLWDNNLGDTGTNTYAQILLHYAYSCMQKTAEQFGFGGEAQEFKVKAERLKQAVMDNLFDRKQGLFIKSKEKHSPCNMSNAIALYTGFCDGEIAKQIVENYTKLYFDSGKVLSLLIEGLYRYGYNETAYEILTKRNYFTTPWGFSSYVDWYSLSIMDDCPQTTSECMLPPRLETEDVECWGDRSHPDTSVSHLLTARVLGIIPKDFGFKTFTFNPCLYGIGWVKGKVPTPYGDIVVEINGGVAYVNYPDSITMINKCNGFKVVANK